MMSAQNNAQLLEEYRENLKKSLIHLAYSFRKIQNFPTKMSDLNEETLETWESFMSRFARTSDIFVMKYLRTWVKIEEPTFEGSTKDLLNYAEKKGVIESADIWMDLRNLRNRISHEYANINLEPLFIETKKMMPILLSLKKLCD